MIQYKLYVMRVVEKVIVGILFLQISCASIPFSEKNDDDLKKTEEKDKDYIDPVVIDAIELKQAKLWARLDDLENKLLKQREKTDLLVKGISLGVMPKALEDSSFDDRKEEKKKDMKTKEPEQNGYVSEIDKKNYSIRIENAKKVFSEGRYGKAYLAFTKIAKDYSGDYTRNEPLFWLGRCWLMLKEYKTARDHFQNFIRQSPEGSLAPSAMYFLAKAEIEDGLNESGIKRLQEIIRKYPYAGSAEAARQMIDNLETRL